MPDSAASSSSVASRPSCWCRSRRDALASLLTCSTRWTGSRIVRPWSAIAAGDRLPDPPGRVGRELEALGVVELLDGADQPEVALLDQVQQRHAAAGVALGQRDDQPQVGLEQVRLRAARPSRTSGAQVGALAPGVQLCSFGSVQHVLGVQPGLDALGELDLLRRGEQRGLADPLRYTRTRSARRGSRPASRSSRRLSGRSRGGRGRIGRVRPSRAVAAGTVRPRHDALASADVHGGESWQNRCEEAPRNRPRRSVLRAAGLLNAVRYAIVPATVPPEKVLSASTAPSRSP